MQNQFEVLDNKVIYRCETIIEKDGPKLHNKINKDTIYKSFQIHIINELDMMTSVSSVAHGKADSNFIIDLENTNIGDGFLYGMCFKYIPEMERFLGEVKIGAINLLLVNIEKSVIPENVGILVEELAELVGEKKEDHNIHIFVKDSGMLTSMNTKMKNVLFMDSKGIGL